MRERVTDGLCLCGCGEPLAGGRDRIKKGHGRRLRERLILCACGCGRVIHEYGQTYYRVRYALGHEPKQRPVLIAVNCLYCGIDYQARPWRRRSGRDFFCSKKCFDEFRRKGVVAFTCQQCGKEVVIPRKLKGSRKNKFCSHRCHGLAMKGIPRPDVVIPSGSASPNWNGGSIKYYGPSWRRQQRLARKRDKVCRRCGAPPNGKALDVHHRIPFKKYGLARHEEANDLRNLVCLCAKCHLELTKNSRKVVNGETLEVAERVLRLVEPGRFGR